jgi:hypothetical protein
MVCHNLITPASCPPFASKPSIRLLLKTFIVSAILEPEIYRDLQDTCPVSLDEIDRATTAFTIRAIRPRDLGAVMHTIKRAPKKHHLEKDLRIMRI